MREIFDSSNEKNLTGRSNAAGSGLFPPFRGARGVTSHEETRNYRSIAAGSGLFSPSADGGMPEGKGVGVNMFNQKRKEVL
jgi:hypothetical protein